MAVKSASSIKHVQKTIPRYLQNKNFSPQNMSLFWLSCFLASPLQAFSTYKFHPDQMSIFHGCPLFSGELAIVKGNASGYGSKRSLSNFIKIVRVRLCVLARAKLYATCRVVARGVA